MKILFLLLLIPAIGAGLCIAMNLRSEKLMFKARDEGTTPPASSLIEDMWVPMVYILTAALFIGGIFLFGKHN